MEMEEEEEDWKGDSSSDEEEDEIKRPRYVGKRTLFAKKQTYNDVNNEDYSSDSDEDSLGDEDSSIDEDYLRDEDSLIIDDSSDEDPFQQEIVLKFHNLCDEIEKDFQKENLLYRRENLQKNRQLVREHRNQLFQRFKSHAVPTHSEASLPSPTVMISLPLESVMQRYTAYSAAVGNIDPGKKSKPFCKSKPQREIEYAAVVKLTQMYPHNEQLKDILATLIGTHRLNKIWKEPTNNINFALDVMQLFCRVCLVYDCRQHTVAKVPPKRKRDTSTYTTTVNSCGAHCHKKSVAARGSLKLTRWTDDEKDLCTRLFEIFERDYCSIALHLKSKHCNEVAAFIRDSKPQPIRFLSDELPPLRKQKKFVAVYWREAPCQCSGDRCVLQRCPCNSHCDKYCTCLGHCANSEIDAACKCKGACDTEECSCFAGERECDPDACQCNHNTCNNMCIAKKIIKHIIVGKSTLVDYDGLGVFAAEDIKEGEFISPYYGEWVIDPGCEAEAAGYSYVFAVRKEEKLNENVDSMYFGNKIRFANHSSNNDNIMCKTMYSQGSFYVGLYAQRDIAAGEELFLDYNYPFFIQAKLVAKPTPNSNNNTAASSHNKKRNK